MEQKLFTDSKDFLTDFTYRGLISNTDFCEKLLDILYHSEIDSDILHRFYDFVVSDKTVFYFSDKDNKGYMEMIRHQDDYGCSVILYERDDNPYRTTYGITFNQYHYRNINFYEIKQTLLIALHEKMHNDTKPYKVLNEIFKYTNLKRNSFLTFYNLSFKGNHSHRMFKYIDKENNSSTLVIFHISTHSISIYTLQKGDIYYKSYFGDKIVYDTDMNLRDFLESE